MSLYADRVDQFNKSVEDARQHAENIASQVENLKAIQRDPTRSLFDKVNDSVSGVAGAVGQAAQIYHTYKHGKVLTFLEQHDINKALGKVGNGGLKNAGNEIDNSIDLIKNAPIAGVAPNSEALQLPDAKELVSSLKGRIIGNESEGATPSDLGQLVGRTTALPDKADNLTQDAVNRVLSSAQPAEPDNPFGFFNMFPEEREGERPPPAQPAESLPPRAVDRSAGEAEFEAVGGERPPDYPKAITAEDRGATFGQDLISDDTNQALAPLKFNLPEAEIPSVRNLNTNLVSGGERVIDNLAQTAGDLGGDVDKAVTVAGNVAKAAGSTLGKVAGEGGANMLGDTIATSMEAVAPETGPIAPLVAAVGGLVALGSSLAGLFHKNKPPPQVQPVAPPPAAQIGADLSVSK